MCAAHLRHVLPALVVAALLAVAAIVGLGVQRQAPPTALASAEAGDGDFAGLVEIGGGRRLYLECRGTGSPAVVLVAGGLNTGGAWSVLPDEVAGPAVLPGVAPFTRVCAYDRPGTLLDAAPPNDQSRSDPILQPTTADAMVTDLHALLQAARVPGPYVLAGHSFGGLIARLYASTFPEEVVGLVLVDAYGEGVRAAMTPAQWAIWLATNPGPLPPDLATNPVIERFDINSATDTLVHAVAARPLRPMPLAVLSAGHTGALTPEEAAAFPPDYADALLAANRAGHAFNAALLPDARHVFVADSGHYIQAEQPQVVIDAIRQVVDAVRDPASWRPAAMAGDFAGLVDIGGRRLYLECRGQGSPTVVLEAGYRNHGGIWSLPPPGVTEPAVLPGVAAFTRVCAYHRPGTVVIGADDTVEPSRSDPVLEVRSLPEIVADLHALLQAAGVPGPYVLAGHSMGGAVVRLYAGAYPEAVAGLVLVDAAHEDLFVRTAALLPPALWTAIEQNYQAPLEGYPEFERVDLAAGLAHLRQARVATPVHPMPLAVLARGRALDVPLPDYPIEATEQVARALQDDLATLVPAARVFVAAKSQHDIHQDQPALVTEAIRQVVAGVRHPDTWDSLVACCTP